jgi:hypothetical protein
VRLEELGKVKEFIHHIGSRTHGLTACSIVPQSHPCSKCRRAFAGLNFALAKRIGGPGRLDSLKVQRVFLFSAERRPALGPTEFAIHGQSYIIYYIFYILYILYISVPN